MSASLFLVSMYLIWIFGSRSIRSNNQSRATLWVLETCLIVGLLLLTSVMITTSSSSKHIQRSFWMRRFDVWGKWNQHYPNHRSLSEIACVFWIVWGDERTSRLNINNSPCSLWLWFVFPRTATIRSHWSLSHFTDFPVLSWFWIVFPKAKKIRFHTSRAGIPSNLNPVSKKMISDSVELCETEVCFLHINVFE